MSAHNLAGEDDQQYDVEELFRPTKAQRTTPGEDTEFAFPLNSTESTGRDRKGISSDLLEQVRDSKRQAIEVLQGICADNTLEHPMSEYLRDIDASYNERDPRITFPKLRAAWTPEEDRLLVVGVRVYGPNTESWPRIAMLVPGRTNKSCRKRWFHSLDPSLHKGPWTQEEDELLRERVAQYPSQWSRVAEGITGRTDDQCAKRWRESLDPDIERSNWTPEEDRLLLDKFAEFGTQWQKIATFFQGRPGLHCRNRWRKIQRILSQKERRSGGALSADDLSKTLASVTESVNRRKTAQRSRPQQQGFKNALSAAAAASMGMTSSNNNNTHGTQADGNDDDTGVLGQVDQKQQKKQQQPMLDSSGNGFSEDAAALNLYYGAHLSGGATASVSAQASGGNSKGGGLSGSIGALFMPSEQQQQQPSTSLSPGGSAARGRSVQVESFRQQPVAKRTSSVLFSPTEEQRLRLRKLGRRLYGCAAVPDSCTAAFADPMSLNTHIKLAHPSIASAIQSLSTGTSVSALQGQTLVAGISSSSPDTSNDDLVDIPANQPAHHHQPPSLPTAISSDLGNRGAQQQQQQVKPYRCAMPGCHHAYKNVNGLEYHIFHSRKSNNHLLPESEQAARDSVGSVENRPTGPSGSGTASLEMLLDSSYGESTGDMVSPSNMFQCVEVECLMSFDSERDLKQHVLSQHPRPIRRAVKPSNRVRGASGGGTSRVMTPVETYSQASANPAAAFWGSTTISEMLSVAAGVAAAVGPESTAANMPMPTIPETGATPLITTTDVLGRSMTPGNNTTFSGLDHRSFTGNLATQQQQQQQQQQQSNFAFARHLPFVGHLAPPQQLDLQFHRSHVQNPGSFMQNGGASAPFLSAPALISANGGEPPSIESYFALNLNGPNSAAVQPHHSLTPSVYRPSPMGSGRSIGLGAPQQQQAASSSMFLGTVGQASVGGGVSGQADTRVRQETEMLSAENMQLMNTMLSPIYMQGGGGVPPTRSNTGDTGGGTAAALNESPTALTGYMDINDDNDVRMMEDDADGSSKVSVRSRRSDSIDLTSLATVVPGAAANQHVELAESSPPLGSNTDGTVQSKSGVYSQMAAALMARRGRQQQMATAEYVGGGGGPTSDSNDITALGLLMASGSGGSQHNSPHETQDYPSKLTLQQRQYTPQYPDLAQFQEQQYQQNIAAIAAAVAHNGTSIVQCVYPGCQQVFNDANALKHHLRFDHKQQHQQRDILSTFSGSNPASPIDGSALSTIQSGAQTSSSPQQFMNHLMAVQGYAPGAMSQPINGMDQQHQRTRAPHWVDPGLWEMWIAAANGQQDASSVDITAMAAATAMGITPGVTGMPQTFLPPPPPSSASATMPSTTSQQYTMQRQHPVDSELLHMFESVNSKSSKVNSSSG
ncbi:hypothetical protein EV175_000187 [Coemansia sp. RSA 1933]|nr:hypothetical protein EV175_000187 [Coemansia sp. RSA 1933]